MSWARSPAIPNSRATSCRLKPQRGAGQPRGTCLGLRRTRSTARRQVACLGCNSPAPVVVKAGRQRSVYECLHPRGILLRIKRSQVRILPGAPSVCQELSRNPLPKRDGGLRRFHHLVRTPSAWRRCHPNCHRRDRIYGQLSRDSAVGLRRSASAAWLLLIPEIRCDRGVSEPGDGRRKLGQAVT